MKYNPRIHHRKSIRLKGYDYSRAGLYFITICCQNRACLFGKIDDGEMVLNDAGRMIENIWNEIPKIHYGIGINEFTIMPNHIHGIITVGADSISALNSDSISALNSDSISALNSDSISALNSDSISAQNNAQNNGQNRADMESAPTATTPTTIPMVVQSFKRYSTVQYIKMVKNGILLSFDKRIWQRNYWEHIIRNQNEYQRISEYIINNPINWNLDKLNGGDGNMVMESPAEYNDEIWMI